MHRMNSLFVRVIYSRFMLYQWSFLGLSAAAVRKYMRNGSMDLGMVLSPQKTGTKTWRYKIYPEKLKQITGSSVPGYE